MLEITLDLREDGKEPYYVQLYLHIRQEIVTGQIPAGTRLPSIRRISEHLGLSRNTIEAAYLQLISEGYVESRPRSGLYVVELEEDVSLPAKSPVDTSVKQADATPVGPRIDYDFRNSTIDLEPFPVKVWNKLSCQVLQDCTRQLSLYGDPQGELGLRHHLANYLRQSRGANCTPEQIVVGAGSQQLMLLLCQLLGPERPVLAMEDPGYNGAKAVFSQLNYPVIPIPLEEDGINLDYLKQSDARLVYVTPSHQFPFGVVLPIGKRLKLLQWAAERRGLIIEDDYNSEFRYHTRPIPSLQGLDTRGSVIYMGTFSKSLLSAIRVSYMVLPQSVLDVYMSWKDSLEPTASLIHQLTLERFMAEGWWEKHVRKMRNIYQKKHTHLLSAIHRHLGAHVKVIGKHSGLHLILEVKSSHSEVELIEKAAAKGVKVYPTSRYWISPDTQQAPRLLLGFGGLTEEQIDRGVCLMAESWGFL